jgi:hypothetical protein
MSAPDPRQWAFPSLKVDRDGDWLSDGTEITHPGILANLRGSLSRDAAGYYVQVGPARIPVEVEDAPFVVVRVEVIGAGLSLTLSDGSQERLDPATLRFGSGEVPYCRVKEGRFEARLSRAAAWQLGQLIAYDEGSGTATLIIAGASYTLARRES